MEKGEVVVRAIAGAGVSVLNSRNPFLLTLESK